MMPRLSLFAALVLAAGCKPDAPKTDPGVTDPEALYAAQCARCHARAGEPGGPNYGGSLGPPLAKIGAATGKNAESLAEYIRDPKARGNVSGVMPSFAGKLTDEQIKILGDWLATKK